MKKINVTHCITSIDKMDGGPSRSVPILCKELSNLDININFITYDTQDINSQILENSNVNLILLPLEKVMRFLSVNFIKILPLVKNTDIFHAQNLWLPFYHWIARYSIKNNIPYIVTPRGVLEPWCLNQKKLKKKLALLLYHNYDIKNASCIYATCKMEADNIRKLGFANPIAIIPNGIDLTEYTYTHEIKKETDKKQLLFLSRIHPKKGIELLIDAFKDLSPELKNKWQLAIVGNGENSYITTLKQKIKDNEIDSCVSILPPVFGEEKIKLYTNSDLFILPSYSENFGMVVVESLASGVPVITTKDTPWEQLIETNSGWWIDLSVVNLKKTLTEAMSLDSKKLHEMGINGRELVQNEYSIGSTGKKTLELYHWILGECEKPSFVI